MVGGFPSQNLLVLEMRGKPGDDICVAGIRSEQKMRLFTKKIASRTKVAKDNNFLARSCKSQKTRLIYIIYPLARLR